MKKYIIFLLLSMFILTNCNNETIKPVDNNPKHTFLALEFFPTSVGSWWIVDSYYLDKNGNLIGNISEDSVAIVSEKQISDKLALEIITYSTTSRVPSDTVYRLIEGDKILEYNEIQFLPLKSWFTIADFSANESWTNLDTNLVDFDFVPDVKFTGRLTISSDKIDTSAIKIKGQEIETIKFKTSYLFNGLIYNMFPIEFVFERTSIFAKNIGLIGSVDDETIEENFDLYYERNIKELKDYFIIKK